ncbi:MAG: lipoyl(octanoyl) transferase [Verrucomicrobia bacterium]|nr:MAG: lipoyl(octanoyl) transferase [Verrucomicrobiota bacterium]
MKAWAVFFDAPLPYARGVEIQERLHAARLADQIPDVVLLLEHTPVVTLGQRGRHDGVRVSAERLRALGVDLARASRGGNVTFHGPGQCVLYPILRLGSQEADAHGYLYNLEEVAIRTAGDFGIRAYRREGKNGAWTDDGKIAAIGFRLKRWVTLHGMSFNVDIDLAGFDLIIPCGLIGERVSSLQRLLGEKSPSVAQVGARLAHHFSEICGRELDVFRVDKDLPADLKPLFA